MTGRTCYDKIEHVFRKNNEVKKVKTKRLVISVLGMLALTAGVTAIGGYTYLTANKKDTVELVAAQKTKNTKELSVKTDSEEKKYKSAGYF